MFLVAISSSSSGSFTLSKSPVYSIDLYLFIRIHGNQRLSELGLSGDKDGLDFSSRSDAAIDGELNWFIKTESWIRIGRRVRRRKQAVYKGRLGKSRAFMDGPTKLLFCEGSIDPTNS